MDTKTAASMFKALGDPTRLAIFEFLKCCETEVAVGEQGEVSRTEGPTAGQVCCHVTGLDKVTSTISFHLKELRNAGLIQMERQGKRMVCAIDLTAVQELGNYLSKCEISTEECCDVSEEIKK
jgi:ArsR family transcriptional regulator, arsenate/arsenite/antimonite-responsive transcriptional repressor